MTTLQAEIEDLKIEGLTRKFTKAMHQDGWEKSLAFILEMFLSI